MALEREREAQALEQRIEGLVDQIAKVGSSSVIRRLERRINVMETEKRKVLVDANSLRTSFPSGNCVNMKVFDFLANPKHYWITGDLKQKRLVQSMVFSEPLKYSKLSGFGTANLQLPFKVLAMKGKDKRSLVESGAIYKC